MDAAADQEARQLRAGGGIIGTDIVSVEAGDVERVAHHSQTLEIVGARRGVEASQRRAGRGVISVQSGVGGLVERVPRDRYVACPERRARRDKAC